MKNCPACNKPLKEGQRKVLLPIGPKDEEERHNLYERKPYAAQAYEVHEICAAYWFYPSQVANPKRVSEIC